MYKNKQAGIIGIIITIIILILIVIFSNGENNSSFFENVASNLVMPIQNGLTYIKNKISGNSTLKEYLNLTKKYGEYKTIPGYVINKDISNYSKTIIINIGEKDGVKENMTVIGNEGLVGHVLSVTDSTAKVQTIVDTASSVSCTMSTTKEAMVCKGTLDDKSLLKAMYIPTDANIIQGDSIETSGIGGIYPKGIHIGTVKKVTNTQNMTDRYAFIETAVNFDKIDTVLVITNNSRRR